MKRPTNRKISHFMALTVILVGMFGLNHTANAARIASPEDIQRIIEELETSRSKLPIIAHAFVKKFYARRNYQAAWSNPRNIALLRQAIAETPDHGLVLDDFHPGVLGLIKDRRPTNLTAAEREILMTDALLRLLYQFYYGKVSPSKLDADWNLKGPSRSEKGLDLVSNALDQGELDAVLDRVSPPGFTYKRLMAGLEQYRQIKKSGGWPSLPEGPVLKPGMTDPLVAIIRVRLTLSGDYKDKRFEKETEFYDDVLAAAVKRFQRNHGLDVDGIIGPATRRAMNVPVSKRIDQIRVNLERARWIVRPLINEKDLVAVNIAGYYLLVRLGGKFVYWTDVITGKPYHKTPTFTDSIKYVDFNPTWTIPQSIIKKEIVPAQQQDPTYLARKGYELFDRNGKKVPASRINWQAQGQGYFPYNVIQPSGPDNALGLVKFMFPNKHNVYLHDTPSRTLFSKTGRAFSHGCVRVQDPMKFAEVILGNRNNMSRREIDAIVDSKKLTRVRLQKPLKVAILYWTVDPVWQGNIRFYEDVYKRDQRILDALNAPFNPPI